MRYTIQNEFLTVQAEDLGAQLASIRTPGGEEYLWQGDPDIWARRAPILFPFIARLREGKYGLDGQAYSISTHGFARDSLFSVVDQGPDRISFQLTDTPETRAVYPFAFSLTVTYSLEGNRLVKSGDFEISEAVIREERLKGFGAAVSSENIRVGSFRTRQVCRENHTGIIVGAYHVFHIKYFRVAQFHGSAFESGGCYPNDACYILTEVVHVNSVFRLGNRQSLKLDSLTNKRNILSNDVWSFSV